MICAIYKIKISYIIDVVQEPATGKHLCGGNYPENSMYRLGFLPVMGAFIGMCNRTMWEHVTAEVCRFWEQDREMCANTEHCQYYIGCLLARWMQNSRDLLKLFLFCICYIYCAKLNKLFYSSKVFKGKLIQ